MKKTKDTGELFLKKHLEIKTYRHKDIDIKVKIDFDKNEISILGNEAEPKAFIFVKRGIEYMNSWINVLDSMKYAITEAKKELESYQTLKMSRDTFIEELKKYGK